MGQRTGGVVAEGMLVIGTENATGGMAELYLGEALGVAGVTKRVALKRMLPAHSATEEFLTMFLEEARLASTLQHANIVQTYDVIRSGDEYIIVMEYLEGADLQQLRRRLNTQGVSLTLEHILYIMRGVLQGLHYAHDRVRPDGRTLGIVHRDVSPQNVFLTYDGGVKLLDFGIAKTSVSLNRTESGILKGKVLYMSPEQCAGADVDRRSDLYSAGVVLFLLLTGTVPHHGKNAYDTMRAIIETPVPSVRALNPRVPTDLDRIVTRALKRRPAERYGTAWEMLTDLETFARDNGLFASTVGFATLVEKVLGPQRPPSETTTLVLNTREPLPTDIDVQVPESAGVEEPGPAPAPLVEQVLAEGEHYTLRRVQGAMVLTLEGVLDEKFSPDDLDGLLKGEVVVDTGNVTRITSFGIRSVITLLSRARPRLTGLHHVRCSVPVINQVTMIRGLLGGGRIISFHAPFVDGVTGTYFTVLLQGAEGKRAVEHLELPRVASPSDESVPAVFDDDAELYLNFAADYEDNPPSHLVAVLRAIDEQSRRLDVELEVVDDGTDLTIRRPIRGDTRWARVLGGLEGHVRLHLEEVPAVDDDGIDGFVNALRGVAGQLVSVELHGVPVPLCEALVATPALRPLLQVQSLQVAAQCAACKAGRRSTIPMSRLRGSASGASLTIPAACGRCGGTLVITTALDGLDAFGLMTMSGMHRPRGATADPATVEAPRTNRGCFRALLALLTLGSLGGS